MCVELVTSNGGGRAEVLVFGVLFEQEVES